MPQKEIDLRPVTHITTDAIGPPGKRVFYIQGYKGQRTVTLIVEKFQIQTLAIGLEQFLAEIQSKFPDLPEASSDYIEANMHINPPVDPMFRIGELALGYDAEEDLVVLIAREIQAEEQQEGEGEGYVVRYWCSRSQIRAMAHWGIEVSGRGRPICPQCGEPMDPKGHFCPKRNGHKH
jgi:uncharacterized repeat protein (TIGR03847 family)